MLRNSETSKHYSGKRSIVAIEGWQFESELGPGALLLCSKSALTSDVKHKAIKRK